MQPRIGENIEFDYINSCHNYYITTTKIDILKKIINSNISKQILEINGENFRKL